MLADRLRMIQVQSLPDFVTGYPYGGIYANNPVPGIYDVYHTDKVIRTIPHYSNGVLQQSIIRFRISGLPPGNYFYYENKTGVSQPIQVEHWVTPYRQAYNQRVTVNVNERLLYIVTRNDGQYPELIRVQM